MSETLARTAERLTALIEEETARLQRGASREIADIQAQKTDLARMWIEGLARLKAEAPFGGPQQKALTAAAGKLDDALARNECVLRAATIAADRVVSAIAEAVREQRACGVGYGMRRQAPRTRAPASGIAVDRKL